MTVRAPFVNVSGDTREMPSGDSLPVSSFGAMGGVVIAPTALAANTNDWAPTGAASAAFWQVSASGLYNLTGIAAPTTAGTLLTLENIGSYPIALTHQDTLSAAGNRFNTPTAQTMYLAPSATVRAFYDGTYWQIIQNSSMSPAEVLANFGDGSDGAATITTNNQTVGTWLTSGVMVRDAYLTNLTINSTGAIQCSGFRIFVNGVLDISAAAAGAIQANGVAGGNASGATAGSTPTIPTSYTSPVATIASAAATGTTGAGAQASANGTSVVSLGGASQNGGAGGAGTNSAGASRGSGTVGKRLLFRSIAQLVPTFQTVSSSSSGVGGSAGGGNGTNAGGGGGGGGGGGCSVFLFARFIYRGTNATAGVIQAKGGAGGNGGNGVSGATATGGGGAGSGGGGGYVLIVCEAILGSAITNGIDVSPGAVGNVGSGANTGANGNAGGGTTTGGLVQQFFIGTQASTQFNATAGTGTQQTNL